MESSGQRPRRLLNTLKLTRMVPQQLRTIWPRMAVAPRLTGITLRFFFPALEARTYFTLSPNAPWGYRLGFRTKIESITKTALFNDCNSTETLNFWCVLHAMGKPEVDKTWCLTSGNA